MLITGSLDVASTLSLMPVILTLVAHLVREKCIFPLIYGLILMFMVFCTCRSAVNGSTTTTTTSTITHVCHCTTTYTETPALRSLSQVSVYYLKYVYTISSMCILSHVSVYYLEDVYTISSMCILSQVSVYYLQ